MAHEYVGLLGEEKNMRHSSWLCGSAVVLGVYLSLGLAACSSPTRFNLNGATPGAGDGGGAGTHVDSGNPMIINTGDGGTGNKKPIVCKPKTCAQLGKNCGPVTDGCGGVVDCGACKKGELCGIVEHNICTAPASLCKPLAKAAACSGKQCGYTTDGCGGMIECGSCAKGTACGLNKAFECGAQPVSSTTSCPAKIASCASVGAQCGKIGNGCGGLIDCDAELGGCTNGAICGGTAPEKCGALPSCTPLTAAVACSGKCGFVSDGCAPTNGGTGLIDCSQAYPCASGQMCGAGGVANKCGDPSSGMCQPVAKATACGSAQCGLASDGCTSSYMCGTCGASQICTSGSCVDVCTPIVKATACSGKACGTVSDGCNSSYDCGSCTGTKVCGQKTAFQCDNPPPATCVALTPAAACTGKACGVVFDGCGTAAAHQIDCSTVNGGCAAGTYCGIKTPFTCDAPPAPMCTPAPALKPCASLGWGCGMAIDGCGNIIDCSKEGLVCNAQTETCIGSPATCQTSSGGPGGGCGVCSAIPDCTSKPQTTIVKGRVITPGRTDSDTANQVGVPNAFVYILTNDDETLLPAIPTGIPKDSGGNLLTACDRCDDQDLGPVLASATTNQKGEFTLSGNIPVNKEFVLVVKIGKWRRAQKYTLAAAAGCATTNLASLVTRLPRNRSDGDAVNIPHIAISTGKVDAMECVLYKLGVDAAEFALPGTNGTGAARIHMYRSTDAGGEKMGSGTTAYTDFAPDTDLYRDTARLNGYDMVVFDCEGKAYEDNTYDVNLRNYANRGGRMFASHWSYTWLHDNGTLNYAAATALNTRLDTSANWQSSNANPSSGTGFISVGRPLANATKVMTFANWLVNEGAVTLANGNYTFTITDPRDLAASVNTGSEEWVYRFPGGSAGTCAATSNCGSANNKSACTAMAGCSWSMGVPFGTCSASANCGSHTDSASCTGATGCGWTAAASTVQQYSFNTPFTAPSTAICGRIAYSAFHVSPGSGDFSGNVFPAGCTGNLTAQEKVLLYMLFDLAGCVTTGGTPVPPACTPLDPKTSCTGLCGTLPNGCGGTLDCGACAAGQVCGLNNMCSTPNCTKTSCAAQGATCGSIADGCGGTLTCPQCSAGQVCGLFTPNQCGVTCTKVSMSTACSGKCGSVSDGCGGVYQCAACSGGQVCINNMCSTGSCTPLTKCPQGSNCGQISDGCSGSVDCGVCTLPNVCGAGGHANQCGTPLCTPLDCAALGADCGYIGDGCGGSKDCGACPAGKVCGLAGANKCGGCMPLSCGTAGAQCGQIGDGCGSSVDCGPCPAGQICGSTTPNKCGTGPACKPQSCKDASAQCGLIGDGCGSVVDCGKCAANLVCGIKSPNQCGAPPVCAPQDCKGLGAQCGAIGDGCGGLIDCGACPPGSTCGALKPNQCSGIQ